MDGLGYVLVIPIYFIDRCFTKGLQMGTKSFRINNIIVHLGSVDYNTKINWFKNIHLRVKKIRYQPNIAAMYNVVKCNLS